MREVGPGEEGSLKESTNGLKDAGNSEVNSQIQAEERAGVCLDEFASL